MFCFAKSGAHPAVYHQICVWTAQVIPVCLGQEVVWMWRRMWYWTHKLLRYCETVIALTGFNAFEKASIWMTPIHKIRILFKIFRHSLAWSHTWRSAWSKQKTQFFAFVIWHLDKTITNLISDFANIEDKIQIFSCFVEHRSKEFQCNGAWIAEEATGVSRER